MNLPVDTTEFWRTRILDAVATGKSIHEIIYQIDLSVWDDIQRITTKILKEETNPADRILDVGCGYGALYDCLRYGIGSNRFYTGIDLSPDLVYIAQVRNPGADFLCEDFLDYEFNEVYDVAVCRSIKGMFELYSKSKTWSRFEGKLRLVAKKTILIEYEHPERYQIL